MSADKKKKKLPHQQKQALLNIINTQLFYYRELHFNSKSNQLTQKNASARITTLLPRLRSDLNQILDYLYKAADEIITDKTDELSEEWRGHVELDEEIVRKLTEETINSVEGMKQGYDVLTTAQEEQTHRSFDPRMDYLKKLVDCAEKIDSLRDVHIEPLANVPSFLNLELHKIRAYLEDAKNAFEKALEYVTIPSLEDVPHTEGNSEMGDYQKSLRALDIIKHDWQSVADDLQFYINRDQGLGGATR